MLFGAIEFLHQSIYIMMRKFLPTRVFLLLLIMGGAGILPLQAQVFKIYFESDDFAQGQRFNAKEVIAVPNSGEIALVGELKGGAPSHSSWGYVLRTDARGVPVSSTAMGSNFGNMLNGVKANTLAFDEGGNAFVGGASVQNYYGVGAGSERTLTSLDGTGKIAWTTMQANHSFESVIFDDEQQVLVAVSGQVGNTNPQTDLMFNVLEPSGKPVNSICISTPTRDSAVKVIAVPDGYLAVATADLDNDPQILVVRVDINLNILWTRMVENPQYAHTVADVAYNGGNQIMIAGTSRDLGKQTIQPFVAGMDLDGNVIFYQQYIFPGPAEVFGTGLVHFQAEDRGYLMSGYFQKPGTTEKRAFIMNMDEEGGLVWTQNYSNFSPYTDYTYEEELSDITFLPRSKMFVAVGSFSRFVQGGIDQRSALMIKAHAYDGKIDDAHISCSVDLDVVMTAENFNSYSVGTLYKQTGFNSFAYQTSFPNFDTRFCEGTIFPKRSNRIEAEAELSLDYSGENPQLRYVWNPELGDGQAQLIDMQGRRIQQIVLPKTEQAMPLETQGLSAGIYFVQVSLQGEVIGMQKLLVQP
jgi:hypothetical protein